MHTPAKRLHPAVDRAQNQLAEGRISRREFIRLATLVGMSASAAQILAACGAPTPTAAPQATEPPAAEATEAPAATGGIKRGGILRIGQELLAVDDPARLSWIAGSNALRHTFEYLTETGYDNITRPYMLESWEANDNLTEWTLKLRPGIKWTNGDDFIAEHAVFNLARWLDPDTGSSILGLFEGFLTADQIETPDDMTVLLHLSAPKLDVPESLFHYPALIMHPSFNGDVTSGTNPFTGAFSLDQYVVGERATYTARDDYWQMGEDGQPLPYLDGIEYVDIGTDQNTRVAALQGGQIDWFNAGIDSYRALENDPNLVVFTVPTAITGVLRMRVDLDPWTDNRVRQSLKLCQERQKIIDAAYFGTAIIAHDCHVSPVHPDFAPIAEPPYDPERAKALLEEAGFADGLTTELTVISTSTPYSTYAQVLAESARAGGWDVRVAPVPAETYWDQWTELSLGITNWGHRPLAVMNLALGYSADPNGDPVAWNETRWIDEEFLTLLAQAQGTLDLEARRAIMADIEAIMQERGPVGIAFWEPNFSAANPKLQNIGLHTTSYHLVRETWIDPEKDPFA